MHILGRSLIFRAHEPNKLWTTDINTTWLLLKEVDQGQNCSGLCLREFNIMDVLTSISVHFNCLHENNLSVSHRHHHQFIMCRQQAVNNVLIPC